MKNNIADVALIKDDLTAQLSIVRIVMIHTTLPANIGSAARAMHTMGLSSLVIVAPKLPIDDTSHAHAAGGQEILNHCQVVPTLDEAIANCQLVFAASSRNRHIPRPVVTPIQAANIIKQFVQVHPNPNNPYNSQVAVLFGREDRGLTNDELARADYHIQIDANPNYPVLNVASAIQVIAAFFYATFNQAYVDVHQDIVHANDQNLINQSTKVSPNDSIPVEPYPNNNNIALFQRQQWDVPPINQHQKQHLQQRIIQLMAKLELVHTDNNNDLKELPNRLLRLLARIQLDQKEFQMINSIIAKILLTK